MIKFGRIENFYRFWVSNLDRLLSGYIYNSENQIYPTRSIFSYYKELFERFLENDLKEIEKINLL